MSEIPKRGGIVIGAWTLQPDLNLLLRGDRQIRLEPRHADLLLFLAAHPGEVFSADQLIEHVWEGQVVTDQSVYQAIAKLRRAFGDTASDPHYIETVARRGYRLLAQVQPKTALRAGEQFPEKPEGRPADAPPVRKAHTLARPRRQAAVAVLALLIGIWLLLPTPTQRPEPEAITVAVLPFEATSGVAADRFIAEGFSIEMAKTLGRGDSPRVIGPISSKRAHDMGGSVQKMGKTLNAHFVVDGALRRQSGGLDISAVLTEVATDRELWAGSFEDVEDRLLQAQRDLAQAIATALNRSPGSDLPRSGTAASAGPQVFDNFLLGRYYRTRRTKDDLERSVGYFAKALQLDADYMPALRGIAAAHLLLSYYGDTPLSTALREAEHYLNRALKLDPTDAELTALIGLSHYLQGADGLAEEFLMRAVATHPNLAEAWMWLGLARQQQGRLRDALPALEHASRLEPLLVTSVVNYANALRWSNRSNEALALLQGLARNANDGFSNRDQLYRTISGALRSIGDLPGAYDWAERAIAVAPASTLSIANKVQVLALLGQRESAVALARGIFGGSLPGRGTMAYLLVADSMAPGVLRRDVLEKHLNALQVQPDAPEIEWRLANLYLGAAAYHDQRLTEAGESLGKALQGRSYPLKSADHDAYICLSLADILQRTNRHDAAGKQIRNCAEDIDAVVEHGWDSLSLAVSRVRLAVLQGDEKAAEAALAGLYPRGFRNRTLLQRDPLLQRLAHTASYRQLIGDIDGALGEARDGIDAALPTDGRPAATRAP